ncbi:cytochrome P450 3A24 [Dermacentor silvarum]|uniref:cytochrome P450 3A24 n=1 Tax=Dermacentor silvarum TaxID=543639 RepID=UPI00210082BA|nr:cytochrome P450 3A24 [Dermacentor silvarum]
MMIEEMHPVLGKSILHAKDSKWRSIRNAVAGGFSAAKIKMMMPLMEEDIDVLLKSLEEPARSGDEVNMLQRYEQLSMDFVARAAFGLDERFQGAPDHPIATVARSACYKIMTGPLHMIAQSTTCFGRLVKPLCWISLLIEDFDKVTRQMATIIQIRKKDPSYGRPDILQNLLDAEYVESETLPNGAEAINGRVTSRSLNVAEVITCAATLFVAGYETIASSLCYLTFVLAKYPDVQEKVRQEVIDTVSEQGKLDFDIVTKRLNYLEQVIKETLRLYPPGLTFVTRQAKQDFTYKGTQFKAGTCFMAPLYQIQRDPRFWLDPLQFNPDRFAPENEDQLIKMALMSFGVGPRNCVGKSMAMLKLKLAMAKLLLKYRLELGPSQMGEMKLNSRAMVSTPAKGPWIIIRHLNKHL